MDPIPPQRGLKRPRSEDDLASPASNGSQNQQHVPGAQDHSTNPPTTSSSSINGPPLPTQPQPWLANVLNDFDETDGESGASSTESAQSDSDETGSVGSGELTPLSIAPGEEPGAPALDQQNGPAAQLPVPAPVIEIQYNPGAEDSILALRHAINHDIPDLNLEVESDIHDYAHHHHVDIQGLDTLQIALRFFHTENAHPQITPQDLAMGYPVIDEDIENAENLNFTPREVALVIGRSVLSDQTNLELLHQIEPEGTELRALASVLINQYNNLPDVPHVDEMDIQSLHEISETLHNAVAIHNEAAPQNVADAFETLTLLKQCIAHKVAVISANVPEVGVAHL